MPLLPILPFPTNQRWVYDLDAEVPQLFRLGAARNVGLWGFRGFMGFRVWSLGFRGLGFIVYRV